MTTDLAPGQKIDEICRLYDRPYGTSAGMRERLAAMDAAELGQLHERLVRLAAREDLAGRETEATRLRRAAADQKLDAALGKLKALRSEAPEANRKHLVTKAAASVRRTGTKPQGDAPGAEAQVAARTSYRHQKAGDSLVTRVTPMASQHDLMEMTADIASAFVSNNTVAADDLATVIQSIFKALTAVEGAVKAPEQPRMPAVPVKKSLTDDYLICLEDGRKFKSLKRHLRTKYNMSPEDYRAKWGLPKTYPMVAPAYAAARSELAKQMGLGQGGPHARKTKPARKAAGKHSRRAAASA